MLNDEKVATIIREHLEGKFPKTCSCCGRVFPTMAEYLQLTTPVGKPISINAALGEGHPKARLGTMAFANCPCGTTMTVSSGDMDPAIMGKMSSWAEEESSRRGLTVGELLAEIRGAIDQGVMHDDEDGDEPTG